MHQENEVVAYEKPTREELIAILQDTVNNIEKLSPMAKFAPITHADLALVVRTILEILRLT